MAREGKGEKRKQARERKRKNGRTGGGWGEFALGNQTSHRADSIVGRDLLCHVPVGQQPVSSLESDTTSLDVPHPDWPRGGTGHLTFTKSPLLLLKSSSLQAGGSYTHNNELLHKAEKHTSPVSESTVERMIKLQKRVFRSHWSLHTRLNIWPLHNDSPTLLSLWGATRKKRRW